MPAITTIPTLDPKQQELFGMGIEEFTRLLEEPLTAGVGGNLLEGGEEALSNLLQGVSPAFMEDLFRTSYMPGQERILEETTLPGIRESMVGAGDFWSTGRANLETRARETFQERMEAQLADLMLLGRRESAAAIPQVAPFVAAQREAAVAPEAQALARLREALPWLELPTTAAFGEPTGAGGGSGGRGGRGTGGGGGGFSGRLEHQETGDWDRMLASLATDTPQRTPLTTEPSARRAPEVQLEGRGFPYSPPTVSQPYARLPGAEQATPSTFGGDDLVWAPSSGYGFYDWRSPKGSSGEIQSQQIRRRDRLGGFQTAFA